MTTTEPTTAAPPGFRIIRRNVCLRYVVSEASRSGPWFGDVASVGGIGNVARCRIGSELWYAILSDADLLDLEIDPSHGDGPGVEKDWREISRNLLTNDPRVVDHPATINRLILARGGDHRFSVLDPESPAEKEFASFVKQWPAVSAVLGVEPGFKSYALFAPGKVRRAWSPHPRDLYLTTAGWAEALAKHLAGDYGRFGSHDATPLTEGAAFALPYQSEARQNDQSIATGKGLVRSAYPFDHPDLAAQHEIAVTTWIDGATTVMDVVRVIRAID